MGRKLEIFETKTFRKDIKKVKKQNKDLSILKNVVSLLISQKPLPKKYREHNLVGRLRGYKECHLEPDWLLIYQYDFSNNLLILVRTGSHSELFKK